MNLLLLAHLIADGGKATEASSGPVWATWVPATIGLLGSLGVAWWSGRKIDKQMELSKQATPPELTRYKEWLEISGKYKELVNSEDVDELSEVSEEYKGINASRKAAFERAIWERKVLAACPNVQAQKRMIQIPASKINEIFNPEISEGVELDIDSYIRPKSSEALWIIPCILLFIFWFMWMYFMGEPGTLNVIYSAIFAAAITLLVGPIIYWIIPNRINGNLEANYYLRKIRVEYLAKEDGAGTESSEIQPLLKVHQYWEDWCRAEGLRYATVVSEWESVIYCPWEDKGRFKRSWHKFWCYFWPSYYVKRSLKGKTEVLWGSYKDDKLNGDLKENLVPKDTQAPNSDTPEESQPTPPQG